jgi:citryl-CoA lyase
MAWQTELTDIGPNRIAPRGRAIEDLMGNARFADVIFLLFTGREPSESESRFVDAILTSSIDHGVSPPSTNATRTVAACRSPLSACVAAGVLTIGDVHGGAIEKCMRTLMAAVEEAQSSGRAASEVAAETVGRAKEEKRRLQGFGHRLHTEDPRAVRLFALARELGVAGPHIGMADAFVAAFAELGSKPLPINVDGAIGACLADLGFPPEMGNAFFIISRVPGLVAHAVEEMRRERPMRQVDPKEAEYVGPKSSEG